MADCSSTKCCDRAMGLAIERSWMKTLRKGTCLASAVSVQPFTGLIMRVRCIHRAGCLMAWAMKSQATVFISGLVRVFTTRLNEYIIVLGWAGLIWGSGTTV